MFDSWHWAGIKGCIRSYYQMRQDSEYAAQTLELYEAALTTKNMSQTARSYAINLAKRLRTIGCDKASAYMAAACSYTSYAFIADPRHCSDATDILEDALENIEQFHPAAVQSLHRTKAEIDEAVGVNRQPNNSPIRSNRISKTVMAGLTLFHERISNIMQLEEGSAATLGYISGALNAVYEELGGSQDDAADAMGAVFYSLFPKETMATMELCVELKQSKEPDFKYGLKLGKKEFRSWLSGDRTPPTGLEELL